MNQPNAEDIVRRATAAFNSGRPDEARQLCEQGLRRAARRADAASSARRRAVFQERNSAGPHSRRDQPCQAARQCRGTSSRRADRTRRRRISTAHCRISIGRSRSRRNGKPFSKRPGRWIRRVSGRRRARPGGQSWKSLPQHQEAAARLGRLAWEDGEHAVAATYLERAAVNDAPALGLVRPWPRPPGPARLRQRRDRLSQGARQKARLCRGRAQSRHRAAGSRRSRQRDARLCAKPIGCVPQASAPSRWR